MATASKEDKPMTAEVEETSTEVVPVEGEEGYRPPNPLDYVPPDVTLSEDDLYWLTKMVHTSDTAQQMFLEGRIDEDQLAKAVFKYGKPSNPSEEFQRADATYNIKLPKWVFQAPEGSGLTLEERIHEAQIHAPDPGPMTHEQLVSLPPELQKKAAADMKKAAEKEESK